MPRNVEQYFIDAMNKGLEHGRNKGRVGWDCEWKETLWYSDSLIDNLRSKLKEELEELDVAIVEGDGFQSILGEAADIANIVMMIADVIRTEEQ